MDNRVEMFERRAAALDPRYRGSWMLWMLVWQRRRSCTVLRLALITKRTTVRGIASPDQ